MDTRIYKGNNNLYLDVKGRIVLDVCETLRTATVPLIDKGISQVYVDLSKVDFIDSAGLGVLVGLKMTSNKNKARMIIVSPSRAVQDIMNVARLDTVFDIINGPDADLLRASLALEEYLVKTVEETPEPLLVEPKPAAEPKSAVQQPAISSSIQSDKEQIEQFCRNAVEFMRVGDYEKAIEEYQKALEIDAEYIPAHNNLAIIYEKRPAWHTKAIEQWQKVLELSQMRGDQKHIDRAQKHLSSLNKIY
jgi:anti-sigma B factor antagonist